MTEISPQTGAVVAGGNTGADRGDRATIGFMLMGALAMTSCCILPLALVSLGVTGVFIGKLSSLYQYHWYFLAFAVGTLAYGFYKAYRPVDTISCANGTCERPINRTIMRSAMWLSAVVVAGALVFQYAAASILSPF